MDQSTLWYAKLPRWHQPLQRMLCRFNKRATAQPCNKVLPIDRVFDLVAVTGGGSGLGKKIVEELSAPSNRYDVVVLDICLPAQEERVPGVHYYECDVSNEAAVELVKEEITKELGTVTVLINNAGIMRGTHDFLDTPLEDVRQTLEVNLVSSFITIHAFLPGMVMRRRGHIVLVGSVLGYVSPARLGAYGASKAGLIALHESLTYELADNKDAGIRTLLVAPGQMETALFNDVQTPSQLVAPVLTASRVAKAIVEALEAGHSGELKLPSYVQAMPLMRALPSPVAFVLRFISGIDRATRVRSRVIKQVTK